MFSNQNMNLLNASAACFIKEGLTTHGKIKNENTFIGGGCITSSEYPFVSSIATEYFSINSYLLHLKENSPCSYMISYTVDKIATKKFKRKMFDKKTWTIVKKELLIKNGSAYS